MSLSPQKPSTAPHPAQSGDSGVVWSRTAKTYDLTSPVASPRKGAVHDHALPNSPSPRAPTHRSSDAKESEAFLDIVAGTTTAALKECTKDRGRTHVYCSSPRVPEERELSQHRVAEEAKSQRFASAIGKFGPLSDPVLPSPSRFGSASGPKQPTTTSPSSVARTPRKGSASPKSNRPFGTSSERFPDASWAAPPPGHYNLKFHVVEHASARVSVRGRPTRGGPFDPLSVSISPSASPLAASEVAKSPREGGGRKPADAGKDCLPHPKSSGANQGGSRSVFVSSAPQRPRPKPSSNGTSSYMYNEEATTIRKRTNAVNMETQLGRDLHPCRPPEDAPSHAHRPKKLPEPVSTASVGISSPSRKYNTVKGFVDFTKQYRPNEQDDVARLKVGVDASCDGADTLHGYNALYKLHVIVPDMSKQIGRDDAHGSARHHDSSRGALSREERAADPTDVAIVRKHVPSVDLSRKLARGLAGAPMPSTGREVDEVEGQLVVYSDEVGASLYDGVYEPAPYKGIQKHVATLDMGKGQGHRSIVDDPKSPRREPHSIDHLERISLDAVRPRTARCVTVWRHPSDRTAVRARPKDAPLPGEPLSLLDIDAALQPRVKGNPMMSQHMTRVARDAVKSRQISTAAAAPDFYEASPKRKVPGAIRFDRGVSRDRCHVGVR